MFLSLFLSAANIVILTKEVDTHNVLWLLLTNYSQPLAGVLVYFLTFVPVV